MKKKNKSKRSNIKIHVYVFGIALVATVIAIILRRDHLFQVSSQPENASAQTQIVNIRASAHDGNLPKNSVDRNLNTRWSAHGNGAWIEYDLGKTLAINSTSIAFYRGSQRTASFKIEVSLDSRDWKSVYDGTSSGKTTGLQQFVFNEIEGRYVRIVGYGNSENQWNSLTEVSINTAPLNAITDTKIPLDSSSVSASNFQQGNNPLDTLDGNFSTRWSAEGPGQWIQYDFGSVKTLSRFRIAYYLPIERRTKLAVLLSQDGSRWDKQYDGLFLPSDTSLQTYRLPNLSARYVRIVGYGNFFADGNSANEWTSLTEVEFFASDTSNSQPTPSNSPISTTAPTPQSTSKPTTAPTSNPTSIPTIAPTANPPTSPGESVKGGSRGYMTTPQELRAIRDKARSGMQPYRDSVNQLISFAGSGSSWSHGTIQNNGSFQVRDVGDSYGSCGTSSQERFLKDGGALAYAKAMAYHINGDSAHAQVVKSKILELSRTYDFGGSEYGGGNNCILELAWSVPMWIQAADLISDWSGWTTSDKDAFQRWLANEAFKRTAYSSRVRKNNWGAGGSAASAIIADYVYGSKYDLVEVKPSAKTISPAQAYREHMQM